MSRLRFLSLSVLLSVAFASPSVASADCFVQVAGAQAMTRAPIVFTGTVTATAGNVATVDVQEIWKGPNLSDPVTVDGGSPDLEDHRGWRIGRRYLFFPNVDADGNLIDNGCSATSVYHPAFDALRPAGAHPPQGPPTSGVPGSPPIAALFLAILVIGSLGVFLLYRAKPPAG
jgi:hypothetical protein